MKPPEQDLEERTPIWDSLQDLFMDTDVTLSYDRIVTICGSSKYSLDEIEAILYNEVMPAVGYYQWKLLPIPEWCGFEIEWLKKRILEKHRYGKRRPWRPLFFRIMTNYHWKRLRKRIKQRKLIENRSAV